MIQYRSSQNDNGSQKSISTKTQNKSKTTVSVRAGSGVTEKEHSKWREKLSIILASGIFTLPNDCLFCVKCPETCYYPLMINRALFTKYSSSQNYYYCKDINDILSNARTQFVILFRDYLTWDYPEEYLKRFYNKADYFYKIDVLTEYYKFHSDIPRIFCLPLSLCLNKYHDKKRRLEYLRITKILKEESEKQNKEEKKVNEESLEAPKNSIDDMNGMLLANLESDLLNDTSLQELRRGSSVENHKPSNQSQTLLDLNDKLGKIIKNSITIELSNFLDNGDNVPHGRQSSFIRASNLSNFLKYVEEHGSNNENIQPNVKNLMSKDQIISSNLKESANQTKGLQEAIAERIINRKKSLENGEGDKFTQNAFPLEMANIKQAQASIINRATNMTEQKVPPLKMIEKADNTEIDKRPQGRKFVKTLDLSKVRQVQERILSMESQRSNRDKDSQRKQSITSRELEPNEGTSKYPATLNKDGKESNMIHISESKKVYHNKTHSEASIPLTGVKKQVNSETPSLEKNTIEFPLNRCKKITIDVNKEDKKLFSNGSLTERGRSSAEKGFNTGMEKIINNTNTSPRAKMNTETNLKSERNKTKKVELNPEIINSILRKELGLSGTNTNWKKVAINEGIFERIHKTPVQSKLTKQGNRGSEPDYTKIFQRKVSNEKNKLITSSSNNKDNKVKVSPSHTRTNSRENLINLKLTPSQLIYLQTSSKHPEQYPKSARTYSNEIKYELLRNEESHNFSKTSPKTFNLLKGTTSKEKALISIERGKENGNSLRVKSKAGHKASKSEQNLNDHVSMRNLNSMKSDAYPLYYEKQKGKLSESKKPNYLQESPLTERKQGAQSPSSFTNRANEIEKKVEILKKSKNRSEKISAPISYNQNNFVNIYLNNHDKSSVAVELSGKGKKHPSGEYELQRKNSENATSKNKFDEILENFLLTMDNNKKEKPGSGTERHTKNREQKVETDKKPTGQAQDHFSKSARIAFNPNSMNINNRKLLNK